MRNDLPVSFRRLDYTPPAWWIDTVDLDFDLHPDQTRVTAHLRVRRNTNVPWSPCLLNGEGLTLVSLHINGQESVSHRYEHDLLTLGTVPDQFVLTTVTTCQPASNTSLMGLYTSSGNFFTQCEAEGFRKITFFPDRPDVMARYRVRLSADQQHYPVLLSNGNLVEQGPLDQGRHYALWEDPFPKPCYLFALVAGQLVCEEATLTTQSGREVLLQVWVQPGNLDKTHHAMQSLIHSIQWDEQRFGLELDLDRFMIVAVSDFNMGAMENKGLNIFNTKYVLANPSIATDSDYANIEAVVGHEYFHNWTGNRVTCRDWFQLSLKEGLTVFRDQEFSADMLGSETGRAVKRIDDVRTLRSLQFPEDAGPMAHPIRPDEYQEISNFYTVTIYEKGAEVVRMLNTLLGQDGFRRGLEEYFRRHDGQAVTCDDFVSAMQAANQTDLTQFRRWYAQAGTPHITVRREYDAASRTLKLHFKQSPAPALHIPLALGVLNAQGQDLLNPATQVLSLTQPEQTFEFQNIAPGSIPSLLRNFSAPVILQHDLSDEETGFLFAHDSDAFNRWEAGQQWMLKALLQYCQHDLPLAQCVAPDALSAAFRRMLSSDLDPAFLEVALSLPAETYLAEQVDVVDPERISAVRLALKRSLAQACLKEWQQVYERLTSTEAYRPDARSAGRRALRNLALSYLTELGGAGIALAQQQYAEANNMTDRFAALSALVQANAASAELHDFYQRFEAEALVIDKWFALQAAGRWTTAQQLVGLLKHAAFNLKNPNRARSVILQFCMNNLVNFHAADGSGYAIWAEYVLKLDELNPQVAARLARCLDRWKRYTPERRAAMQGALQRVANKPGLSKDTLEIVSKALA
ncbi:MAG: aminopeptidase N [Burkholderiales bacterium]|jgi:aminopeptidase N|nr:aminopeptidase N [Burkholderiales bacterium]MCA3160831.1 aminopeptidase N [Burkholderiales bacterium]MCA3163620.1 aminopeptidase N [Burkholderiales bacterium]MCA3166298.1 aminopeptidase N [Burkholderiales bacterium]MCA3170076.1 aminopeptidase N [Burkholderiales bacterium]